VIDQLQVLQKDLQSRLGTNFAFLGDEIYLKAGRSLPPRKHYGKYPQIEDGVGMVRSFHEEFAALSKRLERKQMVQSSGTHGTVVTGTLFAPVLEKLIGKLNTKFSAQLSVVAVPNGYFGGDVSVAGLLTGQDLLAARQQLRGDFVLLPKQMLKSDEPVMLDGMTLAEVQTRLGKPVRAVNLNELGNFLLSCSTN